MKVAAESAAQGVADSRFADFFEQLAVSRMPIRGRADRAFRRPGPHAERAPRARAALEMSIAERDGLYAQCDATCALVVPRPRRVGDEAAGKRAH